MLLQEKMKMIKFSPNEKIVIKFILEKQELIANYSTIMIADETYTSPSILIRIAKKLNFRGWIEFKTAFLEETAYLRTNFQDIDANAPFSKSDSFVNIASKIAQLKMESAKDTLSLVQRESLQKAISIMKNHDEIKVFGLSNVIFLGEEFVYKLRHIQKKAEIFPIQNTMFQEAVMTTSKACAICISYTGESEPLLETIRLLKQNGVPIIAVTSIGDNSLTRLAEVTLHITTREKSFTKIAGFSSLESISLVLDILYSCYFATEYDKHYDYKINLARMTESRQINNQIIRDD
ncbi:MurR/RpiR family transcriptional regulator [Oceanobacillus neutriphilus]|uniref:RpiR family transcriptional regulator n=1 Tax=Oceanobacillus neutriphilus TaxID=531815 RepID=A0ABQ2NU36_9BACI|nr:MurR/RpiR family transcriptional regulator [Oceanobacillus neutriphilus]GGP10591.1 RpiR family transcriptional regulator [Oceanobacillus neutriphilus]